MDIISFKKLFDTVFSEYLCTCISHTKTVVKNDRIDAIRDHLFAIATGGGKRIRPYCVYVGYSLYGGKDHDAILRFAIITELLHTMALVHDDIMDESSKRHNIPTIHNYLQNQDRRVSRRIAE